MPDIGRCLPSLKLNDVHQSAVFQIFDVASVTISCTHNHYLDCGSQVCDHDIKLRSQLYSEEMIFYSLYSQLCYYHFSTFCVIANLYWCPSIKYACTFTNLVFFYQYTLAGFSFTFITVLNNSHYIVRFPTTTDCGKDLISLIIKLCQVRRFCLNCSSVKPINKLQLVASYYLTFSLSYITIIYSQLDPCTQVRYCLHISCGL